MKAPPGSVASAAKFGMARIASAVAPITAARIGPLAPRNVDPPALPGPDWVRLRPRLAGICGSDLPPRRPRHRATSTRSCRFPFTPGHEVVGDARRRLARRASSPCSACRARGIEPPCADALPATAHDYCERIAFGHLEPGLQCGFCDDTGGGWAPGWSPTSGSSSPCPTTCPTSERCWSNRSACAVHAVRSPASARRRRGRSSAPARWDCSRWRRSPRLRRDRRHAILVAARYPHQQAIAKSSAPTSRSSRPRAAPSCAAIARQRGLASASATSSPAGSTSSSTVSAPPSRSPQALQVVAPRRRRRSGRHARRRVARPHGAVASRGVAPWPRTPTAATDFDGRDVRPRPTRFDLGRALCPPPIGSTSTSTPSPTPRLQVAAAL